MATYHTYTIDGYQFAIVTGFLENGTGQVVVPPDSPVDDLTWKAAFKELVHDFPRKVFLQELHYDMHRDLSNDRYLCQYHLECSLPMAKELTESYPLPNDVWLFFSNCASILNTPKTRQQSSGSTPTPGYVYLLQSDTGHYKIGRAKTPDKRIKTFGIKLPFKVEYLAVIKTPDMIALEKQLHERYEQKRINGEWFDLLPEDVDYIKGLAS
jgi:hypothetical protein